ncbi:unnamed protein product [Nyctereutes procyonoides]|uniref:(raccoon dog) hypothetical protein n=1 Tax=Nyctereutes procyonoides TaxID=34880 RepID=A0A812A1J3_NYCPR|nr:unnamed protein product [Nyctereutes procyonoides]
MISQLPLLSLLTILQPSTVVFPGASFCLWANNFCPHWSGCRWGFPAGHHAATSVQTFPRVLGGSAIPADLGFIHCVISTYYAPHTAQGWGHWQAIYCVASWPLVVVSTFSSLWFQTRFSAETRHPASLSSRSLSNVTTRREQSLIALQLSFSGTGSGHTCPLLPPRRDYFWILCHRLSSQGRLLLFESFMLL